MPSDMWVLRLSQTTRPRRGHGEAEANRSFMNATILFGAGITDGAANRAVRDIECGDQGFGAVPDVCSNSRRSTCPGFIGSLLAARSRAWIPVISSIETV